MSDQADTPQPAQAETTSPPYKPTPLEQPTLSQETVIDPNRYVRELQAFKADRFKNWGKILGQQIESNLRLQVGPDKIAVKLENYGSYQPARKLLDGINNGTGFSVHAVGTTLEKSNLMDHSAARAVFDALTQDANTVHLTDGGLVITKHQNHETNTRLVFRDLVTKNGETLEALWIKEEEAQKIKKLPQQKLTDNVVIVSGPLQVTDTSPQAQRQGMLARQIQQARGEVNIPRTGELYQLPGETSEQFQNRRAAQGQSPTAVSPSAGEPLISIISKKRRPRSISPPDSGVGIRNQRMGARTPTAQSSLRFNG